MYTKFFGFHTRPFSLVPDPDVLYWSAAHKQAYNVLLLGILSKNPITLMTGEIGAGKTTLLRAVLDEMEGDAVVGLISNAQGGRGDLLRWVLNAFDIDYTEATDYVSLFQTFQTFLLEAYAQGKRVVLIVDEAQNLSAEGLEEIRMLTNINSGKDELIQLVLVGQPELRRFVQRPEMKQLAQRVATSIHLGVMDRQTCKEYIAHRLRAAGGTGEEFTTEAAELVFHSSDGVPRRVNQLCDLALVFAFGDDASIVAKETVQNVLDSGLILQTIAEE